MCHVCTTLLEYRAAHDKLAPTDPNKPLVFCLTYALAQAKLIVGLDDKTDLARQLMALRALDALRKGRPQQMLEAGTDLAMLICSRQHGAWSPSRERFAQQMQQAKDEMGTDNRMKTHVDSQCGKVVISSGSDAIDITISDEGTEPTQVVASFYPDDIDQMILALKLHREAFLRMHKR